MFASLKNKIKEETGSDVAVGIPASGNVVGARLVSNNNRMRSRFSSTISVNSMDDTASQAPHGSDHMEVQSLRCQCSDLVGKVNDLTQRLQTLQEEKARLEKSNEILQQTVEVGQTQKDLYSEEQEKIQNIQQAEIEKLKSLLSFREQEAVDRLATIKQNQQQIENLTGELERLKVLEPMVEDLQETLEQEKLELQTRLTAAEERFTEYAENSEHITQTLRQQNAQLHQQLTEISNCLEMEKEEKLTALLRNAEISQSEEILKKELRIERDELNELQEKTEELQAEVKGNNLEISKLKLEVGELQSVIRDQDEKITHIDSINTELNEKNKTIKNLNQRLADIKKTVQREIRGSTSSNKSFDNSPPLEMQTGNGIYPHSMTTQDGGIVMDEVNFKYLKHVIVKFLTSREIEARHLIRAVATLLKLSKEEEKLLHDTLNWKMSWFGSKPDHGTGQRAFSIPPS